MPVSNTEAVTAMLQFLLPASLREFKSTEQANACELLFLLQMHSLIVLGTGAGKSLVMFVQRQWVLSSRILTRIVV